MDISKKKNIVHVLTWLLLSIISVLFVDIFYFQILAHILRTVTA